jgi:hypothetical protein
MYDLSGGGSGSSTAATITIFIHLLQSCDKMYNNADKLQINIHVYISRNPAVLLS